MENRPVYLSNFWLLLALLIFIPKTWSKDYLTKPQECKNGIEKEIQVPEDPHRYFSDNIHNQGKTGTCGFHTGTNLLEVLYNSENMKNNKVDPIGLSVLGCMQKMGICIGDYKDLNYAQIDLYPFLFIMQNIQKNALIESIFNISGQTIKDQCDRTQSPLFMMGNNSSTLDAILSKRKYYQNISSTCPRLPSYNVQACGPDPLIWRL